MSDPLSQIEFWVDELWENHECGPYGRYSEPISLYLSLSERDVTLISPFELYPARIVSTTASESGDLLFLIAREPGQGKSQTRSAFSSWLGGGG